MTTEERFEGLQTAVARIAESQANAWDAIGALAKEHANLARGKVELGEGLSRLELLIERYIAAKGNGHNGADQGSQR